jgi:hypothetical protein
MAANESRYRVNISGSNISAKAKSRRKQNGVTEKLGGGGRRRQPAWRNKQRSLALTA